MTLNRDIQKQRPKVKSKSNVKMWPLQWDINYIQKRNPKLSSTVTSKSEVQRWSLKSTSKIYIMINWNEFVAQVQGITLHNWFKSYRNFKISGAFYIEVKFHQGGFTTNGATRLVSYLIKIWSCPFLSCCENTFNWKLFWHVDYEISPNIQIFPEIN